MFKKKPIKISEIIDNVPRYNRKFKYYINSTNGIQPKSNVRIRCNVAVSIITMTTL